MTLAQIIILLFSAKHFLHAVGLLATHGTDRIMTTWAVFQVAGGNRGVVVATMFMSAIFGTIGALAPMSAVWRAIIIGPQQILLTMSCYGSLLFTWHGITPAGVETDPMVLFLRQLPLVVCGTIHFFAMVWHVSRTP